MKKIFFVLSAALSLTLTSCNEELEFDVDVQNAPIFTSFSPTSGIVGTHITIEGENLQNITTAYINDIEVAVSSRISGKLIEIIATQEARSGTIKIVSAEGEATSSEEFTFNYPTPQINSLPESLIAGASVYVEGSNLSAIQELWINSSVSGKSKVSEFSCTPSELLFKIPSVEAGDAQLQAVYFNGSDMTTVDAGSILIVNDGVSITSSLDGTYAMGEQVVVTGSGLAVVGEVLIGGVAQNIIGDVTANNLVFEIVDDATFSDGLNTADLTFTTTEGNVEFTKENFQITMPVYYLWQDRKTTARAGDSTFFNLENGRSYSISQIATLDPIAAALDYQPHTEPNVLSESVSDEQYYSVPPYIYQHSLGSGSNLYGPAARADRMGGLGTPFPKLAFGTPSVILFVLDPSTTEENNIIKKIKNGTFTESDFDPDLFASFDIGDRNKYGELTADKFAPDAGATNTPYNANPGSVILVMQMKPNRNAWSFNMSNVYKFGILELTNLTYTTSAHEASATFNAMWQRTPNK